MQKIVSKIVAVVLLIVVIALPIVSIIAVYSGGLIYFGITYVKMSDFILFVFISIVLEGLLDFFFETLIQVSFDFKIILRKQMVFFKLFFDFITSVFSLLIVDHSMDSLSVSIQSVLLFSLFTTGISYFMSNHKEEPHDDAIDLTLRKEIQDLLSENNIVETIYILKKTIS